MFATHNIQLWTKHKWVIKTSMISDVHPWLGIVSEDGNISLSVLFEGATKEELDNIKDAMIAPRQRVETLRKLATPVPKKGNADE